MRARTPCYGLDRLEAQARAMPLVLLGRRRLVGRRRVFFLGSRIAAHASLDGAHPRSYVAARYSNSALRRVAILAGSASVRVGLAARQGSTGTTVRRANE